MMAVAKGLYTLNHIECSLDETFDYSEEFSLDFLCLIPGCRSGEKGHLKNVVPAIFPLHIFYLYGIYLAHCWGIHSSYFLSLGKPL